MRLPAFALLASVVVGFGAEVKPFKWSGGLNVPDPTSVTFDEAGNAYVASTTRRKAGDLGEHPARKRCPRQHHDHTGEPVNPLTTPARLEVRQSSRLVPAIVETLHERLQLDTMEHEPADALEVNDLGIATILLAQPLVVEPYAQNREMGAMVLVDPSTNRTVAAVMVTEVLEA